MVPISVCIITYNEEKRIRNALESVKWTDEIIIIDSGSTDKTIEICREYTDKIYHQDWLGYIAQKNHALQFTSHDWILSIDSDEVLSPELIREIQIQFQSEPLHIDGFIFPRKSYYLGRWIKHSGWYPDYQLRVFRKSKAVWKGIEPHDRVELKGAKKYLSQDLYHYSYSDLDEHLATMKNYAEIWVKNHIKQNKPSYWTILFRPLIKFIEVYLIKGGILDGYAGLVIAYMSSFQIYWRYVKLTEMNRNQSKSGKSIE